jgi:ADP-ribose pyrophosphatase
MIGKWKTLDTKELFKTAFFRLRSDRCELPDGRVMPNYYVMEFPDWVNIIPVTDDGHIVLVEQYRHASGEVSLELPGGSTTPAGVGGGGGASGAGSGAGEDPQSAAVRELLEETGYAPTSVKFLRAHRPNPAMQTNFMQTYIGFGCKRVAEQELDPFEDIRVVTLPVADVVAKVFSGEINHSIIVASILYALPELGYKGLV